MLSIEQLAQEEAVVLHLLEELAHRDKYNSREKYFPIEGKYRRTLYPKHWDFFAAGLSHKLRAIFGGNRVGKTLAGAYEAAAHLLQDYPTGWPGRKFSKPVNMLCVGINSKLTRDVLQKALLGRLGEPGTGMIPKEAIIKTVAKSGTPDAFDIVYIQGKYGVSTVQFQDQEQDLQAFMGKEFDVAWLDEESKNASARSIFTEVIARTILTDGLVYATFTPLSGQTDMVGTFLPEGLSGPDGYTINAKNNAWSVSIGFDNLPHYSEQQKKDMLAACTPFEVEARTQGVVCAGIYQVYPVDKASITCPYFTIPVDWPRVYGFDPGDKNNAVVWLAIDPNTQVVYLYDEYKQPKGSMAMLMSTMAHMIRSKGAYIPGVVDPNTANKTNTLDGRLFKTIYEDEGLDLTLANNVLETGIATVYQMLSSGRLKIMPHCVQWFSECRRYHREEDGKIKQQDDHLMDATRYAIMSGLELAVSQLEANDDVGDFLNSFKIASDKINNGADDVTGY